MAISGCVNDSVIYRYEVASRRGAILARFCQRNQVPAFVLILCIRLLDYCPGYWNLFLKG